MTPTLLAAGREALVVALLTAAPPVGAALVAGLLLGVLQAATQVQDPTPAAAARLAAVLGALGLAGPWMGALLVRFAARCLQAALQGSP